MSLITARIKRLRDLSTSCETAGDAITRELLREAADTIETLSAKVQAANMERSTAYYNGGWIPVSERLPEDGQSVLFCDIDDDIMIGHHVKGRPNTHFTQDGTWEDVKNVRAWMSLPEPYKSEEREQIPDIRVTAEEAAEAIQNLAKAGISQEDIESSYLPQYEGEWVAESEEMDERKAD